ncbi:MAG: HEAT repeat domain-containing protein [Planctomycetes bacterium]|nr:HEAT repeat domain-containing protein [Planctomycetota bacterium]
MKNCLILSTMAALVLLVAGCSESKLEKIEKDIRDLGSTVTTGTRDAVMKKIVKEYKDDEDAINALFKHMKNNKDSCTRRNCALTLAKMGVEDAEKPIREMMFNDKSDKNRAFAVEAMAILKKENAIPDLIKVLKDDKDTAPRDKAKELLGSKKLAPAACEQLIPYLTDPDINMRQQAQSALVAMEKTAIPPLLKVLNSTDNKDLILNIFQMFAKIGDTSVVADMKVVMGKFPAWEDADQRKKSDFYKQLELYYNKLYTMK